MYHRWQEQNSHSAASNQLKAELGLDVIKQCVHQILRKYLYLKYQNRLPKPWLKQRHKNARISFYEKYKFATKNSNLWFSVTDQTISINIGGIWDVHVRHTINAFMDGGGSFMVWALHFHQKASSKYALSQAKWIQKSTLICWKIRNLFFF